MAKNFNLKSATFGAQAMGDTQNCKVANTGEIAANSAGVDVGISAEKLVNRKGEIQVSFNDLADAIAMLVTEFGLSKTLVLVFPSAVTGGADITVTVVDCIAKEVLLDAQHNDFGAHITLFEAKYADGSSTPFSSV